jgi:hypothetical protein
LRDLEDREIKNILNLEMDKLAADITKGVDILLEILNSFSPRFFSFINPTLLGFPDKSVKMLQSNS